MKRLKINMDKGKTFKEGFQEYLFNCKARGLREVRVKDLVSRNQEYYIDRI